MTSELHPAVEVALAVYDECREKGIRDGGALIKADRKAVRAEQAAELTQLRTALSEVRCLVVGANHAASRYPTAFALLNHCEDNLHMVGQSDELAKFKALAETLAFMLEAGTRFMPSSATVWHREAAKALRQYKEARDAS